MGVVSACLVLGSTVLQCSKFPTHGAAMDNELSDDCMSVSSTAAGEASSTITASESSSVSYFFNAEAACPLAMHLHFYLTTIVAIANHVQCTLDLPTL